jgi:hypothetical protein
MSGIAQFAVVLTRATIQFQDIWGATGAGNAELFQLGGWTADRGGRGNYSRGGGALMTMRINRIVAQQLRRRR